MGIINVLDFQVANLIAAGEVVERPASAVKELVENSIDAGAGKITVEIKNGGSSLIRVSDNGKGILRDDVPVAVKRHATSKIRNAADLDGITTLGFRGEALAAISSVSRMRIITRAESEKTGTLFECYAGENVILADTGAPVGTTVIVEELFVNVPARRKFLKKDATEAAAVSSTLEKIAISHPEVGIKFINDGAVKFETAGDGELFNALYAVFGREFVKKLVPVNTEMQSVRVAGYIGSPDNIRANRNFENFFINGRYVKCRTAQAALEQAFDSYIPHDRFPVCVLNIALHPSFVDVNVHPSKLEVKFGDERPVFRAVYSCVRGALERDVPHPDLEFVPSDRKIEEGRRLINSPVPSNERGNRVMSENVSFSDRTVSSSFKPSVSYRPDIAYSPLEGKEEKKNTFSYAEHVSSRTRDTLSSYIEAAKRAGNDVPFTVTEEKTEKPPVPYYRIIGEAFKTYVFVELENKILIIDKHAAHERMNFQALKKNLHSKETSSQLLLVPVFAELTSEETGAVAEFENEIKKTGFDFEIDARNRRAIISAVPIGFDKDTAKDAFITMADRLYSGSGIADLSRDALYEKALYQASCKAAIKGGVEYDESYLKLITERLLTDPEIRYCPHGRPVAFEMTKDGFEKQFKRK